MINVAPISISVRVIARCISTHSSPSFGASVMLSITNYREAILIRRANLACGGSQILSKAAALSTELDAQAVRAEPHSILSGGKDGFVRGVLSPPRHPIGLQEHRLLERHASPGECLKGPTMHDQTGDCRVVHPRLSSRETLEPLWRSSGSPWSSATRSALPSWPELRRASLRAVPVSMFRLL